jgi:hypothetical protein
MDTLCVNAYVWSSRQVHYGNMDTQKNAKRFFSEILFGFVCDVFKLCRNYPISWMAWVVGLGWIRKHATPG